MSGQDELMRTAEEMVGSEKFRSVFDYFDLGLDSIDYSSDVEVYIPEETLNLYDSDSSGDMRVMLKLNPSQIEELDEGPWREIKSMEKAYSPDGSDMIIELTDKRPEGQEIEDRYENLEFNLYNEEKRERSRREEYGEDLRSALPELPDRTENEQKKKNTVGFHRNNNFRKKTKTTNKLLEEERSPIVAREYNTRSGKANKSDLADLDDLRANNELFYNQELEETIQDWMIRKEIYDDQGIGVGIHLPAEINTTLVAEGFEEIEDSKSDNNELAMYIHSVVRALGNIADDDLDKGDEYEVTPCKMPKTREFKDLDKLAKDFHSSLTSGLSNHDENTCLAYDIGFASALIAEDTPYDPNTRRLQS